MAVVALVVTMFMLQWCLLTEAQLSPVDAAALFDLCDRPGTTGLWPNCSDSANACINTANWTGVNCDANKTSIVRMCDWSIRPPQHECPPDSPPVYFFRTSSGPPAIGGSLPASIGKMAKLQLLCVFLFNSLTHCDSFMISVSYGPPLFF